MDSAPIDIAGAFLDIARADFPWIQLLFIARGSTSFDQPLDISMMKRFKGHIQHQCPGYFSSRLACQDATAARTVVRAGVRWVEAFFGLARKMTKHGYRRCRVPRICAPVATFSALVMRTRWAK